MKVLKPIGIILLIVILMIIYASMNKSTDSIKKDYMIKANKYTLTYLKQKYPEQNFNIIEINVSMKPLTRLDFAAKQVVNPIVKVYVKDSERIYTVWVNVDNGNCIDNVQQYEIKDAIIEKISEIMGIEKPDYEQSLVEIEFYRFK